MDNVMLMAYIKRLTEALEGINANLTQLNKEGIVVFGGQTMEEN